MNLRKTLQAALAAYQGSKHQRESEDRRRLVAEGVQDLFSSRQAQNWTKTDDEGRRRILGHPGQAAADFVSTVLAQFDVHGEMKVSPQEMKRDAGHGAFAITDGVITVRAEFKPRNGVTASIEIPITVKNGYMQSPGMFNHEGTPYVLSQSAIDDVLALGRTDFDVKTDRENLWSFPGDKNTWRGKSLFLDAALKRAETARHAQVAQPMPGAPDAGNLPSVPQGVQPVQSVTQQKMTPGPLTCTQCRTQSFGVQGQTKCPRCGSPAMS